jgi:hypothetical protein
MQAGLQAPGPRASIARLDECGPPFPVRLPSETGSSPIAVEGLIIVAARDNGIYLVNEQSGALVETLQLSGVVGVTPAIHAGTLFATSLFKVTAFDLAACLAQGGAGRGAQRWDWRAPAPISQPLLLDSHTQTLYVCAEEWLCALQQENGHPRWNKPLELPALPLAPPLLVAGHILVFLENGEVALVGTEIGALLEHVALPYRVEPAVQPFALSDRAVYADPTEKGRICEIAVTQYGLGVNQLFTNGSRVTSLAASEEFIALGHLAGLTLMDRAGTRLWRNDDVEAISTPPIVAGQSIFALNDLGQGLLFGIEQSTPKVRRKMLSGVASWPPMLLQHSLAAVSADGQLAVIGWRAEE